MPTFRLIHATCADALACEGDGVFDASVCDPPYGLGTREPKPAEIADYLLGRLRLNTGGDFMGRDWSIPSVEDWRAVYRVLKPGAYLAAFGGCYDEETEVLTREGWIPFPLVTGDEKFASINDKQLALYLRQFGKAWEKFIPDWMKRMQPAQLRTLWYWYMCGDGTDHRIAFTSSPRLRDDLQEIALYMGISADWYLRKPKKRPPKIKGREIHARRPQYSVVFNHTQSCPEVRPKTRTDGKTCRTVVPAREWGDKMVYCVELERNHILYVRRGGKAVWCGNTRTFDLISLGIRAAGFELRDTIMAPCLMWVHGQGWPKGLDVSKAIDELLGAEREVVGRWECPGRGKRSAEQRFGITNDSGDVTAPATPEAQRWDGWNSQLKPAWEPVLLFQKPISESTIARNVLRWGTGALNIGACRVSTGDRLVRPQIVPDNHVYRKGFGGVGVPGGRYPSNLILQHLPGCRRIGERQVRVNQGDVSGDEPSATTKHAYGEGGRRPWRAHGQGGVEVVPEWECASGCPSAELGRQSTTPGKVTRGGRDGGHTFGPAAQRDVACHGDEGTAERFFPSVEWGEDDLHAFRYVAKVKTQADRGEGNTHVAVKPVALLRWLTRLLCPPGGTLLDPFCGSGSGGVAALRDGACYVGVERDAQWIPVARRRMAAHGEEVGAEHDREPEEDGEAAVAVVALRRPSAALWTAEDEGDAPGDRAEGGEDLDDLGDEGGDAPDSARPFAGAVGHSPDGPDDEDEPAVRVGAGRWR